MEKETIAPRNTERPFQLNELFFSTTDKKGLITSGNEVFVRVSGYVEAQLLGQPHNKIRHPAMPRAVFKLLWDTIAADRPIVAYVKNMASDGTFYWVMALVTPLPQGYLSVRFKPTGKIFSVVEELYRELRTLEQSYEDRGDGRKLGMRAAETELSQQLVKLGFPNYPMFMCAALREEMKSRDEALRAQNLSIIAPLSKQAEDRLATSMTGSLIERLAYIRSSSIEIHGFLSDLFAQLDTFVMLNNVLAEKSKFVLDLTSSFQMISLNTSVRSTRLGVDGASLRVIAEHMGNASREIARVVSRLDGSLQSTGSGLEAMTFSIAAARLQVEMIVAYCHESIESIVKNGQLTNSELANCKQAIKVLQSSFRDTLKDALAALLSSRDGLFKVDDHSGELHKTILTLRFSQLAGLVESMRVKTRDDFSSVFRQVEEHLNSGASELTSLRTSVNAIQTQIADAPRIATAVEELIACGEQAYEQLPASAAVSA